MPPPEVLDRPQVRRQEAAPVQTGYQADLPIKREEANIKRLLFESDQVVVVGQTGSGKTTWLPRFMHDVLVQRNPNARVLVTQPKKIAVDNVATHVRGEMGEEFVGYRYKNANTITDKTKIGFMVDGSLVNELIRNPTLEGWDGVMIDEVHEETEDMVLELALLKKAQELRQNQGKRELSLVVTSGTLDLEKVKGYLPRALSHEVEGRQHPIEDRFSDHQIDADSIVSEAVETIERILSETTEGDILVFMPGRSHITETIADSKIRSGGRENVSFHSVTGGDQDKSQSVNINEKAAAGQRRVFVATDAAQTSITIQGIKDVVLSGLKKVNTYDTATRLSSLRLSETTKTDIKQQRGRAGRETEGRAWYLMTQGEYDARPEFEKSEVERIDLTSLVLRLKNMEVDNVHEFDFITRPDKERIDSAITTLQKLGGIDSSGKITEIGRQMAEFPLDPHFSRMLIEAKKQGCVEAVSVLIGFLSNRRSVFANNPRQERFEQKYKAFIDPDSDYLTLLNVWNGYRENNRDRQRGRQWMEANGLSRSVLYEAGKTANELLSEDFLSDTGVSRVGNAIELTDEMRQGVQKCIVAAFADGLLIRERSGTYSLENGKRRGIAMDRTSAMQGRSADQIVSGGIRVQESGRAFAGFNQRVDKDILAEVAPYLKEAETAAALSREIASTTRQLSHESLAAPLPSPHHVEVSHHAHPVHVEPEKSIMAIIKESLGEFWGKIKKFFRWS